MAAKEAAAKDATNDGLKVAAETAQKAADEAAAQWTGRFNPRPFDAAGALEIYQQAL